MAQSIKAISDNEKKFVELWSEIIKRKSNIQVDKMDEAASYINFNRTGNCASCNRRDAIELNNIYKRLLPLYTIPEVITNVKENDKVEELKVEVTNVKENDKVEELKVEVIKDELKKATKKSTRK